MVLATHVKNSRFTRIIHQARPGKRRNIYFVPNFGELGELGSSSKYILGVGTRPRPSRLESFRAIMRGTTEMSQLLGIIAIWLVHTLHFGKRMLLSLSCSTVGSTYGRQTTSVRLVLIA